MSNRFPFEPSIVMTTIVVMNVHWVKRVRMFLVIFIFSLLTAGRTEFSEPATFFLCESFFSGTCSLELLYLLFCMQVFFLMSI
jgi:hypothetical protein